MRGLFITFEGTEGSGKTTIIEAIWNHLTSLGYDCIKTREPGGSVISEEIRHVILDPKNTKMDAKTEVLLYAASRRQHLIEVVLPALARGTIVLCDRYVDSSLAYQGCARDIGFQEVYELNQFAIQKQMPDLTLYIDVRPEVGLARIQSNHRIQDRLDLEAIDFHKKVYAGYEEVLRRFPERVIRINGEQTVPQVVQEAMKALTHFLESYHGL
ncbi:MAG: dTMP kinase [Bacilli bacterium]|nr:dTMP kinase [Bacilli bacterium]